MKPLKILTVIGISIFFVMIAVGAAYNSQIFHPQEMYPNPEGTKSGCPMPLSESPHEDAVWNLDSCYWFLDDPYTPYEPSQDGIGSWTGTVDGIELQHDDEQRLVEIVFGDSKKRGEHGWINYPGGAGPTPPQNFTVSRIYKEVTFGIAPLDFIAMLDDKIFVDKCESYGGVWDYTYHDCVDLPVDCSDVNGVGISTVIPRSCTVVCFDVKVYRISCVFPYEN